MPGQPISEELSRAPQIMASNFLEGESDPGALGVRPKLLKRGISAKSFSSSHEGMHFSQSKNARLHGLKTFSLN